MLTSVEVVAVLAIIIIIIANTATTSTLITLINYTYYKLIIKFCCANSQTHMCTQTLLKTIPVPCFAGTQSNK